MQLSEYSYEGFYARFDTPSKEQGYLLMGADNIVGDDFELFFKTDEGRAVAWLKNKFGTEVGYFDADASRKLQLARARELETRCLLSFVAFSDSPDPGCYWGQMAVFIYNPAHAEAFNAFIDRCAERLGEGLRPQINLGRQAAQKILDEPDWMPSENVPLPKKEKGFAVLKSHRSLSEKMIEQGRSRNIGCYIISWIFIALVLVGIGFALHSLGLF